MQRNRMQQVETARRLTGTAAEAATGRGGGAGATGVRPGVATTPVVPGVALADADVTEPWNLACLDVFGRVRTLTARLTRHGTVTLQFPPGEVAVLGYRDAEVLDAEVLDIVASVLGGDRR